MGSDISPIQAPAATRTPTSPPIVQPRSQASSSRMSREEYAARSPGPIGAEDAYAEGAKLAGTPRQNRNRSAHGQFRDVARLIIEDKKTYGRVHAAITERYNAFNQRDEVGHNGKPGVTGDIEDVSLEDLCAILRHIAVSPAKTATAAKKSAISPLFDKLYLMQNKEQGWALRLHKFAPGEKSQGDEEMPHYHRWTLGSKILSGGYNNKNYTEIGADEASADEKFYKYSLKPSQDGTARAFTRQEPFEVGMRVSRQTLFKKGDVRHFPIELPHSVSDLSRHTGTTLTLAHTAKGIKDASLAFEKDPSLQSKPLAKPATLEEFAASILDKIALLQVISLSDKLHEHLLSKEKLTPGEQRHVEDHSTPNYLETSLLPSLAILDLESPSTEFSKETQDFIREQLNSISKSNLSSLLVENQKNLENGAFSASVNSWNELERLI